MSNRRCFIFIIAVMVAAVTGISAFAFPAAAAELAEQTLSSGAVTVEGEFEQDATLTVSTALYSEEIIEELTERNQIRNEKQIVAIYDIAVSGEVAEEPIYSIKITNLKLNSLAKNKIAMIDSDGAYTAIPGFDYNKSTITFRTDTLGKVIIYEDMTLFYVIVSVAASIIVLIIALKIIDSKRFKEEKEGKNRNQTVREHDKKYHW
ncbi:MAG: hypothetical protein PHI19_07220 [Clostridia bacterium]|nr:hypothetical protein [Clostridia bacterium]